MEEKLKTLKDIEGGVSEYYDKFLINLKAEAVKWIRNLEGSSLISPSEWIKHFFNITEEDLKKEKQN